MAKSPAVLKHEFAELLGPGRYARIVWQAEGKDGRKPNFDFGVPNRIMALDTRDGIVRELVPAHEGSHWSAPTFTWDGKHVVFTDNEARKVCAVAWDGTGKRVLMHDADGDGHCWQSPDGKQWALATEHSDDVNAFVKVYRVNVNDPADKVTLLTTSWARPEWAGSTCWASLSVDGTHMAAGFPNYADLGLLNLTTGTIDKFAVNGCWPTMSRDNAYDIMYTNSGEDSHKAIVVIDKNQRVLLKKNLGPRVLEGDGSHESLRWTPDRDLVTVCVYKGMFLSAGIPNPRIVRVSDLKYVAINDRPSAAEGNADVFFYS